VPWPGVSKIFVERFRQNGKERQKQHKREIRGGKGKGEDRTGKKTCPFTGLVGHVPRVLGSKYFSARGHTTEKP